MATKKVEETPAVSTADIDDLKAQIASIQNLAEVTHKALDALQTRVDSMEDKSSEGTGTTDEQKFEIIWDYIHIFNSHLICLCVFIRFLLSLTLFHNIPVNINVPNPKNE